MPIARILVVLAIALALPTPCSAGDGALTKAERAKAAGCWSGGWRGEGYEYEGVFTLDVGEGGQVEGTVAWTLRSAPAQDGPQVGRTGGELVRGIYSPDLGILLLSTYKLEDPAGILGPGLYQLRLAEDGLSLSGVTAQLADRNGQMALGRCPGAA
jgi:hypothetical protein